MSDAVSDVPLPLDYFNPVAARRTAKRRLLDWGRRCRRGFTRKVLPLALSLTLHATLVLAGVMSLPTAVSALSGTRPGGENDNEPPDALIDVLQPAGGVGAPWPGSPIDRGPPGISFDGDCDAIACCPGRSPRLSRTPASAQPNPGPGPDPDSAPGRLTPFGVSGGVGVVVEPAPASRRRRPSMFFRDGACTARSVIFAFDESGSMINTFGTLKSEIGKAVESLRPDQSFAIIVFNSDRIYGFEADRLLPATAANKRQARRWMEDVTAGGTTDPAAGLKLLLPLAPELLYLVTDGDFPNNDEIIATIRRFNIGRRTRINTIAFVASRDVELPGPFIAFMKTIARENGGTFDLVVEEDL